MKNHQAKPQSGRLVPSMIVLSILVTVAFVVVDAGGCSQATPRLTDLTVLLQELRSAPVENADRARLIHDLFLQAGAPKESIRLLTVNDAQGAEGRNVIVRKAGATSRMIVLGAHHDKVRIGNGVIDDWSGCIAIKNLYRALRDIPTRHTLEFVGFAMEEKGLLGSIQYVNELKADKSRQVAAMANFECLGVGGPFTWANGSDDRLEALARSAAEKSGIMLEAHELYSVSADSVPFTRAGIPAITIDGLPVSQFRVIHSVNDRMESLSPQHYQNAYKLGVEFVLALDRTLAEGMPVADFNLVRFASFVSLNPAPIAEGE